MYRELWFLGEPMNIARQTTKYEEKGFSREKAEINALMENAILAIFRDFPDAFLLSAAPH
jgi:hypothetical protein